MATKRSDNGKDLVDPPSIPPTFRVPRPAETKALTEDVVGTPEPEEASASVPKNMFDFSEDDDAPPPHDEETPEIAPPQLLDPTPLIAKPSLAKAAPPPKSKEAGEAVAKEPAAAEPAKKAEAPAESEPEQAAVAEAEAEEAPKGKKKGRLAERARRPGSAKKALDVVNAVSSDAEPAPSASGKSETKAAKPEPAPAKKTPDTLVPPSTPAKKTSGADKAPRPKAAPPPATPVVAVPEDVDGGVASAVRALFPSAVVVRVLPISEPRVFRALWIAHRVRAQTEKDLQLAVTANLLLDALERLPAGGLAAAEITLADKTVAVWVDLTRAVLFATASPATIYLAGL